MMTNSGASDKISAVGYGAYCCYKLDGGDGDSLTKSHGSQFYRSYVGLDQSACFTRIIYTGQASESEVVDILHESRCSQSGSNVCQSRVAGVFYSLFDSLRTVSSGIPAAQCIVFDSERVVAVEGVREAYGAFIKR